MITSVPKLIEYPQFRDERGTFQKVFTRTCIDQIDQIFEPKEAFYSVSKRGVLRGMHFQKPGAAHNKLVAVIDGSILDVVVDLRNSSNDYGKTFSFVLNAKQGKSLFIPKGFAHGFYAIDNATVMYLVDHEYSAAHDDGVLWNSINFDWPDANPTVSQRDSSFEPLVSFESPF